MNPAVGTGSPAVTIEFVSPHTLVRVNSPIPVRATFSEPVSGFTVDDVIVGNGTADGFTGSDGDAVYTFNVTPNAIGVVTADIPADAAADGDRNGNTAAAQLWLGIPYDDDRDDEISKAEAISAVRDYFNQQITKEDTIGVIRLYFQPIVGADSEALELTTVMLDGSAPVPAAAFQWEQLNNGSPTVVLASADTARASFTLPALRSNQDFIFRLTVTYAGGHTSQDAVTVTGRPTPGVIVGVVSGNTASLNGAAEFVIRLRSRPSAEVVIPLSSSDESEGILEQTQVVFTPEDWNREQVVVARGGMQDYEIILGNSQSSDRFYDGLEIANVPIEGIALEIAAPQRIEPLLANLPTRIEPRVTYTGRNRLSFALTEAPAGMSIDFSYGTITWTPQESDEGRTFDVTVKVNDGAIFSETSFPVTVIQPEPLATEIQDNLLTVADLTTTLNGLEITSLPDTMPVTTQTLEDLQETLGKAPLDSVPEIPSWITPISDVFVVTSSFENPVELHFSLSQLPEGVSLDDVDLYAYVEALDVDGQFWSTVLLDNFIEGVENEPHFVVQVGGMQGMAFFGYHRTSPAMPFGSDSASDNPRTVQSNSPSGARSSISVTPPVTGSIECDAEAGWLFGTGFFSSHDDFICTAPDFDADIKIRVKDFPAPITGWAGGSTVEELAMWAIKAQLGIHDLGLGYDKEITVKIEHMPGQPGVTKYGYVTNGRFEGRRTIHLTDDPLHSSDTIKGTLFHEFFHHAQGHDDTRVTKISLPHINLKAPLFINYEEDTKWLTEGTAEWFIDEVDDDLNGYTTGPLRSGLPIMETGLNSLPHPKHETLRDPYERFSFFKLLTKKCDNFHSNIRNLLNDRSDNLIGQDQTGIENLSRVLGEAECDFGEYFGPEPERRGSIEAAIVYYNYATQGKNNILLLDEDELDHNQQPIFRFVPASAFFNLPDRLPATLPDGVFHESDLFYWPPAPPGNWPMRAPVTNIPAAGAFSVLFPFTGHPLMNRQIQGKVAELVVEPVGGEELVVSITGLSEGLIPKYPDNPDNPENTIGLDSHAWFSTSDQTNYIYSRTLIPQIFVTVVNPSLSDDVEVEVSFRIRDEVDVDLSVGPIITSHTDGAQVSDRVVTVRGSMPEEGRDATKEVIVTANGIETRTALNLDGSFAADVVIGFGDNSIKAQGFDDQATPVTNETGITIEGVASLSTRPNALIPSRVVFVLRWDTDRTDIDLHSTDGEGGHIYFRRRTVGPGNLDRDDVFGFGPEVISYRETDDNVYVNGTFDVDVVYFSGFRAGSPATNYTLDVILNESGVGDRRLRRFESITPLTRSDRRFNSILGIFCGSERVCGLDHYDNTKLSPTGISTLLQRASSAARSARSADVQHGGPKPFPSAYEQCMSELETALAKSGSVDWSCNPDGTKQWP